MTPEETLVACAAAYNLLAEFFRNGLTPQLLADMQELPGIADILPESVDAEARAVDHYRLLGLNVFPYASAYLEEDGRLGGATTDRVSRMVMRTGLDVHGSESPDHISCLLDALAYLCRVQVASMPATVGREEVIELQQGLLSHLFAWVPVFRYALAMETSAIYGGLAAWVLDLAADHFREIPAAESGDTYLPSPDSPNILEDESTGLRRLAEYLCRPARSGLVLTRSRIEALARELDVPRGFGDRVLELGNLMSAAGKYDRADHLINRLETFAGEWSAYFAGLDNPKWPAPVADVARIWRSRVDHTADMLHEMSRRLQGGPPES